MHKEILEEYIGLYERLLFKVCKTYIKDPFECENIVQETYLSFYKNIETYSKVSKDEAKNILCKIALNKCKDYLKSAYVRHVDILLEIDELIDKDEIENKIYKNERKIFISEMIRKAWRTIYNIT